MSKVGWYDPFLYFTKINIYIYIDHHLTLFLYVRVNRYIYIEGVHFRYVSYLHVHSLVIEVMLVNGGERLICMIEGYP